MNDARLRYNHDQWPPGDPLELDPPTWMLFWLLVLLGLPILVVCGVWEGLSRLWRR